MKELLPVNDSLANKVSFYHIALFMVSLPFDLFYSHVILVSFCVHTLIQLKKCHIKPVFSLRVLAVQAVFFITVIATIYTAYPQQAFTELGRQVVFLVLPLVFCFNTLDIKKYRRGLLLIFSVSCAITVVYLYVSAFLTIRYYGLPFRMIFSDLFTNHNFSEPIGIHATFLSMQLVVAMVSLLYLLTTKISRPLRAVCFVGTLILFIGLIQLASKSILIIVFLLTFLVFPYYLLKPRNRLRFVVASVCLLAVVISFIFSNHTFKDRYVKGMVVDLSGVRPNQNSESRMARWQVVVQDIKESPIIGHGSGSEVKILGDGFFNHKLYDSYLHGLNSHNQYLSFWFKDGIWGLAIYLLVLAYGFKIAISKRDVLFISFMLLIAIISLSENILDVDKGVCFYGFFLTFFLFSERPGLQGKNNEKSHNYLTELATN